MKLELIFVVLVYLLYTTEGASNTPIYTDSVLSPASDWSWATTRNPSSTSPVYSGSFAYSFVPSAYQAIYFHLGNFSTQTYSGVTFAVWTSSSSAGTETIFALTLNGAAVGPQNTIVSYLPISPLPANTWVVGSVTFPPGIYDGLWFQDVSGNTNTYTVVLDNVELVAGSSSSTTTSTTGVKSATTSTSTSTTTKSTSTSTSTSAKSATTSTSTTTKSATTSTSTSAKSATTSTSSTTTGPSSTTGGNPTDPSVWPLYNTAQTGGDATYYYSTPGGNCGLDNLPPAGSDPSISHVVAISSDVYFNSETCGMCISITPTSSGEGVTAQTVFVTDQCPTCGTKSLDLLSSDTTKTGIWPISWQAVPCPVGSTKIQYVLKSGTSIYYLALQIRNTKYPVSKLEVELGSTWYVIPRENYNYFVWSPIPTALVFPLNIRITSVNGEIVVDSIASLSVIGSPINGSVQF